jgi:alcohol dehydrogenase (cytochrome c)
LCTRSFRQAGAGATNWPSASFDPETGQFLVFATESCAIFVKNDEPCELGKSFYQGTERHSPNDTSEEFLRAIDIQTGKISWEIPKIGGCSLDSGLMSTAGGIVLYADGSGAVVAANAKDGKILWHFDTGQQFKGSPMASSARCLLAYVVTRYRRDFVRPDQSECDAC